MQHTNTFREVVIPRVFALILWVATLVIGLIDIFFLREIAWAIYAKFSTEGFRAALIGQVVVLVAAVIYLGYLIISTEYHLKHVGKPESWRLFYQSLVVELLIPFLAFFV